MLGRTKKKPEGAPEQRSGQSSLALQIANRYLRWILVLVIGGVLFAGYTFILDAQISDAQNAARESLPAKQKELDDLKAIKAKLDEAILDYEKIKERNKATFDKIDLLLPRDSRFGQLFTDLDGITASAGFKLLGMSVAPPSDAAAQPAGAAAPAAPAAGGGTDPLASGQIRTLPVEINVEGDSSYESYKRFLQRLEENVRLFDVQSIAVDGSKLIPQADTPTSTAQYDVQFMTYYQP